MKKENEPTPLIELVDLTKEFDGQIVLKEISLKIYENEFVTLLGPSGCGKTTTLRIIGGFVEPTKGKVLFEGKDVQGLPPYKRATNTVFQKYALFPHLDVYDNIAFGLRLKRMPLTKKELAARKWWEFYKGKYKHYNKEQINKQVMEVIKLVNMTGYEHRSVSNLSGGQQQRVAIARAIVNKPRLLLLDESLAALDLKLRKEMQYELKELQKETGITFIFVTHDQEEALTMSDKIVVMKDGYIEQIGSPEEIYNDPINRFVATFIGDSNLIPGRVIDEENVEFDGMKFGCDYTPLDAGEEVDLVLRPEDLDLVAYDASPLHGIVDSIFFKGVFYEVDVMTEQERIITVHTTDYQPVGKKLGISFDAEDIHVMELM